jgi:threonylcarbamoyladenosine tRNA methylthiotransferase MtaB
VRLADIQGLRNCPIGKLVNVAGYHVENFGCRASRSDGESIASGLRLRGLAEAASAETAQVVVLNTCSVTAEADRSARAFLRRVRRQNPEVRVVVTGCYAQRAAEEIARLDGVNAVVGNSHKALVPEITLGLTADIAFDLTGKPAEGFVPLSAFASGDARVFGGGAQVFFDANFAHAELATLPFASDAGQTRPNLKIQDGCGNRCSFCVIPETRGPSRSVSLVECLENVRRFVDGGGQELVLSGINLGRWGRDFKPAQKFEELVAAILRETALPRLRLSSIEPMDWSADLMALFCEYAVGDVPRLAPHAHLPLQSGSDAILRRMYRRYRPWHYAERVAAIRAAVPDAAIGADVMVGFPGETDTFFDESYRFIAAQPLTYLHLFPFSARPGTPAWEWQRESPVPAAVVAERMAALRSLGEEKARVFRAGFVGRTLSAVTLRGAGEATLALTANFLKMELNERLDSNRMAGARVTGITKEGLLGCCFPAGSGLI